MIALGALVLACAAAVGWFARGRAARILEVTAWALCLAGSVALVVSGGLGLAGHPQDATVADPLGDIGLRVDAISGLFLVIAFGVAVPVVLAALVGGHGRRPRLPAVVALVLLCAALVIGARDLFALVAGWEALGFAFYLAIGFDRGREGRPAAAMLAMSFSKVSGAALLLGGLLLAARSHTLELAHLADGAHGPVVGIAFALLVFAFTTKVGLVPMHLWLPPAYASAPGPARAVLAGVAVNVGFYGLWRTLATIGPPPVWLVAVVLVVGGLSAILGISHAAVHADLARLVAWSSVENAGLIVVGYGVALLGATTHSTPLTAAGLIAATAQVIAHALGKSLLFVATSDIEHATGTTDLDLLRGIARVRPAAGVGLAIGAFTLAGLPLTAGFASEWLTLEALMQQFRLDDLTLQLCNAAAAVLVALTIGVAGLTFVRVVGLTVLGTPSSTVQKARRASWSYTAGVTLLTLGCLGAAAFAPLEIRLVAQGIAPIVGSSGFDALTPTWILQPVFGGFSALSPSWLWIVLPAYVVLISLLTFALSGRRLFAVRRVDTWASGSEPVRGTPGYTSFAFANPIRKVLAGLLMTRHELREEEIRTGGRVIDPVPGEPAGRTARLGYTVDVVDVVERYLYRPGAAAFRAVVHTAKKLQSGRLDAYMAYMLVALVAVIAVVTGRAAG